MSSYCVYSILPEISDTVVRVHDRHSPLTAIRVGGIATIQFGDPVDAEAWLNHCLSELAIAAINRAACDAAVKVTAVPPVERGTVDLCDVRNANGFTCTLGADHADFHIAYDGSGDQLAAWER